MSGIRRREMLVTCAFPSLALGESLLWWPILHRVGEREGNRATQSLFPHQCFAQFSPSAPSVRSRLALLGCKDTLLTHSPRFHSENPQIVTIVSSVLGSRSEKGSGRHLQKVISHLILSTWKVLLWFVKSRKFQGGSIGKLDTLSVRFYKLVKYLLNIVRQLLVSHILT